MDGIQTMRLEAKKGADGVQGLRPGPPAWRRLGEKWGAAKGTERKWAIRKDTSQENMVFWRQVEKVYY